MLPCVHSNRRLARLAVGVNRNDINPMRHGETSLFQNCTETFPSPSGDNYRDPCLDYSQYTMYTTGALHGQYRGYGFLDGDRGYCVARHTPV